MTYLMVQVLEARTFLELAQTKYRIGESSSLEELLTQQALFRSFLLSYGKCFSQSGKGRGSLDAAKVFPKELREVHKRVMELRNRYAAHNDDSGLDEAAIEVVEEDGAFKVSQRYAFAIPLHEYDSYQQCIRALDEHVVQRLEATRKALGKRLSKRVVLRSAVD